MHPLITHFLNLENAVTTLDRAAQAVALSPDETAFIAAAAAHEKAKASVLKGRGKKQPSNETQQALILLAAEAATARTEASEALGARVKAARAALLAEGAEPEEAHQLLVTAVLEESFGTPDSPDEFDEAGLGETFEELVALAAVTSDRVDDWLEAFAKHGDVGAQALRVKVAEALLEAAWSEGPQPIAAEHVDDAMENLAAEVARTEFDQAGLALVRFLEFLGQAGLIKPRRLARLSAVARAAATTPPELDEALEEELDEGDDEA
jgi:hypothetical protein